MAIDIDSHTKPPCRLLLKEQVDSRELADGHRLDDGRRDKSHAVKRAPIQQAGVEAGDRLGGAVTVGGRYLCRTPFAAVNHQVEKAGWVRSRQLVQLPILGRNLAPHICDA